MSQELLLSLIYFVTVFATPTRLLARGRILSRWMRRLLRHPRNPVVFRCFVQLPIVWLVVDGYVAQFVSNDLRRVIYWGTCTMLFLDDLLTGEDHDPWWKEVFGKVKLWMPAPVYLRPIERGEVPR